MDSSNMISSINQNQSHLNHNSNSNNHQNHSRQSSHHQNQLHFLSPSTSSGTSNHSRHHSLNSINLTQLTNLKTMSLHDTITCSSSTNCNHKNGHFRHYHCQLDNNIQLNSFKTSTMFKGSSHATSSDKISKWTLVEPELIAIAICNFYDHQNMNTSDNNNESSTHVHNSKQYLPLCIGDVLIIVERCFGWFRGYYEHDPNKFGIFPSNYVQVFDDHRKLRINTVENSMVFYYYTLLDPLYLQVIRILREWHRHLVAHYRTNVNMEKFLIVRNLIYELLELCSTLNKDLGPSLWRRRSNQLLKINSDPKDPFAKLYLGEEGFAENDSNSNDDVKQEQSGNLVFDSSLEDLYDRILCKLNQGNQHLNLDIMPSFTHGTFNNSYQQKGLIRCSMLTSLQSFDNWMMNTNSELSIKKRNKFSPYYIKDNCKYLTYILDYYNHINRGFNQKFKSNIATATSTANHRNSFSSYINSPNHYTSANSSTTVSSSSLIRKFRRHLLFSIREANFSNVLGDSDQLQIDVYILRCNDPVSGSDLPYEVLTEKYCYRVNQQSFNSNKTNINVNRALFLDVLSKRSPQNGLSTNHHFQSQHSDASNYYMIIQVWRHGKMLLNEGRTKNMLSATSSLTTGSSVFQTISSSSISSAAVAATSNSLSSITSFVSNSSLFNNSTDKSNSSGTPDSSSIDSSEFGSPHFKRSVGFAVIPLLELVSRDKEIRPSAELFQNENFLSKILFSDESMLLPVPVKLYEGDLTVSILEMMLKHRQALTINSLSNVSSQSSISKLSPLINNYQLVVCAKFISELMVQNQINNKRLSNNFTTNSLDNNHIMPPLSLADNLLLSQNSLVNGDPTVNLGNFVLIQKRCFGDLITAGYFRNDFYLTLESAEFEKGGKTIPKNIEVSVCLITENGLQERAITSGVNMEPVTIYRSHIQYHQNSPKWFEHIKVNVPLEQFETAHLRFVFCHCSSKERERKFLGFSFLPLADQNGACLPDGEHELHIYKCDSERKLDDVTFYLNVPWGQHEKISSPSQSTIGNSQSSLSSNISSSSLVTSNSSSSILVNSRSAKEVFHVKTTLISSKLTQNSDILSLLKWSCTPLEQVYDSLQRISRVPGEEMVKFLEDILDALFALFTSSSDCSSKSQTLIFRVIVDFFKTLNDPKFISYRSALEKYIEKQFSAPLVYTGLICCVKKYIELVILSVQQNEQVTSSISGVTKRELEFILRCLSVFDWLLKMIVQSRILYTRASISGNLILNATSTTANHAVTDKPIEIQTNEEFKDELLSLFSSITRLLSVECKSSDDYLIVAIQESVLSSLPNAFTYLSQILKPFELAKLVQSLVHLNNNRLSFNDCFSPISSSSITPTNSTPTSCSTKKTIINAKLLLLQHSIQFNYVWLNEEARLELLDTFIRLLNICISESKYCLHILRDIIIYLIDNATFDCFKVRKKRSTHLRECEIEMLSFGAIDAIVEHIIEMTGVVPTSFDLFAPFSSALKLTHSNSIHSDEGDYLGTMIICLMVLLDFMTLKHYEKLFEKRSTSQCKELILNIFAVFLNALYYFPDNWLEIKMAVNRIMLHSLTMLRTIMSQKFLGPDRFDETIWRMYFKLAIAFLTQQRLQLESQHYWKRRFILDVYGCDMRILMGFELVACWDLIGPYKISFIPSMVSSFVDVTLVPELELRKATIPIFYDMLMVDYISNSNFKQVEAALIDKLDVVAHKNECDFQFKELFTQILTEKIETSKPVWIQEGLKLVQSISRLLALLIDYRNELKRKLSAIKTSCEVDDRLLICTYTLLRFFRDDIESSNRKNIMLRYLEKLANVHMLLGNYAEAAFTLKLQADQLTWSTNESQKKESLCQTMLNYFEKGQCWEEGIKVCKDLQHVYERSYKYSKLSATLKRYAELLDKILTQHRSDNEYFRVSFYGLDFPSFLQNSTFIFRGLEFEKISSFTHRIQQEFPNAQLLTKIIPSDENINESKCQYIQIFSVKPIPEPPVLPDQTLIFGTPDNIFNYYNTNSVRQFTQDRPIQRAPFDPNNEFKSLWIERTTYTTEQSLPGMLRMFKVISTSITYLSPIENACETIENKNNELSKLISTYNNEAHRPESISPLSMRLQGILDAAVNGGIAKYIDAFLDSEFLSTNPDQVTNVARLKDRIANQIQIVEAGLNLHGRLAPTAVRPLHTRLLERFATMRNMINQANIEISQALLWAPSSIHRPSILSQPLPPIPQRQDTLSDPDTSSLSSNSSLQTNMMLNSERSLRTPPPSQLPPLQSLAYTQSPGNKSLKNKPLPPLPQSEHISTLGIKRHHSNIENRSKLITEDAIYSVPQYTDLDLNNLPDNESSVDDSMDYCDVQVETIDESNNVNGLMVLNSRINRSLSIPCSALSLYNGNSGLIKSTIDHKGQSNENLVDLTHNSAPPPPLPPRASTLDRSNSLNSGVVRSNHLPPTMAIIPPALPQRPVKKSSSNCNNSQQNGLNKQSLDVPLSSSSHFPALDGLEFENLLLSSPTPLSTQSSRPAPIIGIEINNNENLISNDPLSFISESIDQAEHRAKSSSLPRSLQQFTETDFDLISENQTNNNNLNNNSDTANNLNSSLLD